MEQIVNTFGLGRSVVVTIPKSWGVKPGTPMKAKKHGQQITLHPIQSKSAAFVIRQLAGGLNFKKVLGKNLNPTQLNKLSNKQYEKVLPGR